MIRRWHESDSAPAFFKGSHDLTGANVSLLPVAAEMRERDAARTARAARRRASWLFRLVSRVRDWRARRDRGAEGRPAADSLPRCRTCRGAMYFTGHCISCSPMEPEPAERAAALGVLELLSLVRNAALRDGRPDLAAVVHAVLLLDLTGNLDDMAPLVAAVRTSFEKALGDDPRVN